MLKAVVLRTDNSTTIQLICDDKQLTIYDVSGHDIHWFVEGPENFELTIKKEYLHVYELFVALYKNVLACEKYMDNKKSPVIDEKIKWYSDEPCVIYNGAPYENVSEIADSVEITKAEDEMKIKFSPAKIKLENELHKNTACVRFRRSGCQYGDVFSVYFNQHFYELLNLLEKDLKKDESEKIKVKNMSKPFNKK